MPPSDSINGDEASDQIREADERAEEELLEEEGTIGNMVDVLAAHRMKNSSRKRVPDAATMRSIRTAHLASTTGNNTAMPVGLVWFPFNMLYFVFTDIILFIRLMKVNLLEMKTKHPSNNHTIEGLSGGAVCSN